MLQVLAVVRPGEQRIRMHCLGQWKRLVVVDDARVDHIDIGAAGSRILRCRIRTPLVIADNVDGFDVGLHAHCLEQKGKRHSGPFPATHEARRRHGVENIFDPGALAVGRPHLVPTALFVLSLQS